MVLPSLLCDDDDKKLLLPPVSLSTMIGLVLNVLFDDDDSGRVNEEDHLLVGVVDDRIDIDDEEVLNITRLMKTLVAGAADIVTVLLGR